MSKKKQSNKTSAQQSVTVAFTPHGLEDYEYWGLTDSRIFQRIGLLLRACQQAPFKGIGKPEPLTGDLTGFWSRRIDREHRLVYLYQGGQLIVVQCRYHYE